MNELNLIYAAMLASWNTSFTADHQLILNMGGEHPLKVDDKDVYLATSDNLNGITIGKVFFHPACESIMSKETEIFKVIRKLTCAKIYSTFQPIAQVLFGVAGKKSGKTLTGKMQAQLAPFKECSKEVRNEVLELIKQVGILLEGKSIDNRLIHWNMNKGGKDSEDRHVYYTATPAYPYYNELVRFLMKNDTGAADTRLNFNGLNVSKQAIQLMIHLFELVFPSTVDVEVASCQVTSPDAARLTAYLNSYILVANGVNSLIGKFRKDFDSVSIYGIDTAWASDIERLGELKGLIPTLDYNNHQITKSPEPGNVSMNVQSSSILNGILNTTTTNHYQQTQQHQNVTTAGNPPVQPQPRNNENYLGCKYLEHSGLYEFTYQNTADGMLRVVIYGEDGRLISESTRAPQPTIQNGMMTAGMGMSMDPATMMQLALVQEQLRRGITPLGMSGQGQMVIDPYTRQPVMATPQQNNGGWGSPSVASSTPMGVAGMDLSVNGL